MTGDEAVSPSQAAAADLPSAPPLDVPAEPLELRVRIGREVLGGADWLRSPGDDHGLGAWLWESWAPVLLGLGASRTELDAVVAGYRRELWLWVMGERTWVQAIQGLAGRLVRRLALP